jgi:hypothetical protein
MPFFGAFSVIFQKLEEDFQFLLLLANVLVGKTEVLEPTHFVIIVEKKLIKGYL